MAFRESSLAVALWLLSRAIAWGEDAASLEFFESRIRPILIQNCYACHNSTEARESGLAVDFREGLLSGGDSGPAVVPGRPDESRLLAAIEHRSGDLKMPPNGLQLSPEILADFRSWISAGAIDPREQPPSIDPNAQMDDWSNILQSRKSWWSFQPISHAPPPLPDSGLQPIDQFIAQKLQLLSVPANPRAANHSLIRRLYWNLIGLPPNLQEFHRWNEALASDVAMIEKLVDSLLDDPRFGERWARHWMDWIRYCESHGSEGDPPIANAWRYRDYLIRSLNESIPLDQMIRQHIAGDLLPAQFHPQTGLNQALIATAHWRMVFHGFAPVDALEERVRFTDDQINAFSKAFLGLTVSCARCHDHKFDPISQADYYALFGILSSCRPGRLTADSPEAIFQHHQALESIKRQLRDALVRRWQSVVPELPERLDAALDAALEKPDKQRTDADKRLRAAWTERRKETVEAQHGSKVSPALAWDLSQPAELSQWHCVGSGVQQDQHRQPVGCGEFVVSLDGDRAVAAMLSGGVCSRTLSDKEAARLSSPDFICPPDSVLWVLCEGDGGAAMRYAVQHYPRNGTVYPVYPLKPGLRWMQSDLSYWAGDSLHVELTTSSDAPLLTGDQSRSWFHVQQVCVLPTGIRPPEQSTLIKRLAANMDTIESATLSRSTWLEQMSAATEKAIQDWQQATLAPEQAELLDLCLACGVLPNDLQNAECLSLVQQYRAVEEQVLVATRVPCLEEAGGRDFPLLVRGDHHSPQRPVPRRFLEAIDGRAFETQQSGRLELADRVLDAENPLTRRVLVNRVWHHLFGTGIVSTPDNFGRLGDQPSHPELLDWLANRLVQLNWSLKPLIREIVLSETWQRSSTLSDHSLEADPDNRWLGRATIRRFEAEALRDALLAVSGTLDTTAFGPPGQPDGYRRSIYLPVMRNALVPLLRTFDFPEPFTTVGRRDHTNVPAQSLALMNDPLVSKLAERWAGSVISATAEEPSRIVQMFESSLARPPSADETSAAQEFLRTTRQHLEESRQPSDNEISKDPGLTELELRCWTELARAMFTLKEFIYVP
ncbi:MAG: PSD1 domain-containing protein [Pirellulaceae bacterium]|nr:PSD1 domain-containing protein [Pirellulaceae bacterium]